MDEQIYRVWYDDPQGNRRFVDTKRGVWFCQEGFWVDDEWQYAVDLDKCLNWIPPHRIVLMSKLPKGYEFIPSDSAGTSPDGV